MTGGEMTKVDVSQPAKLDVDAAVALGDDLDFLARLHDREPDAGLLQFLRGVDPQMWFALKLSGAEFAEGARLMREALAEIGAAPSPQKLDDLAADFAAIYLTHAYRASPCESFWRDEDNLERQQPMFEVREFYQRHGFGAPDWRMRADDHIAFELSFLGHVLRESDQPEKLREAAEFLRLHLLRFAPEFARRVVSRCQEPFFGGAALLSMAYLLNLRDMFAETCGFDMTPPPEEPRAGCGDGAPRPTCADPPQDYREGLA